MEVIGAASAIIAVLDLVAEISTIIRRIYRRYNNAPQQLEKLRRHLLTIEAASQFLIQVDVDKLRERLYLDENIVSITKRALLGSKSNLQNTLIHCRKLEADADRRYGRLVWSLRGESELKNVLDELQSSESSLTVVLQLIQLVRCYIMKSGSDGELSYNPTKVETYNLTGHNVAQKDTIAFTKMSSSESCFEENVSKLPQPWSARSLYGYSKTLAENFGINLNIASLITDQNSFYHCFAQLPIPTLFGIMFWKLDIIFETNFPWYRHIHILGGSIRVHNVIPTKSQAVQACLNKDIALLRNLLRMKKVCPNDVTPDSRPLLWYAATSGSKEVIETLLHEGADATMLTGPYHTDILSRAIFAQNITAARLLISHKANVNHINTMGFTPVMHIFNPSEQGVEFSAECCEMLISHDFKNINTQNIEGFTALHRAASYGTATDITRLLAYGADPNLRDSVFNWTPIFSAVRYDNVDTWSVLSLLVGIELLELKDIRGWNLLHVAVYNCSWKVIPLLFRAGFCPNTLSIPSQHTLLDSSLRGRHLSPLDLAEYNGKEQLACYNKLVGEIEYDIEDEYWSAEE